MGREALQNREAGSSVRGTACVATVLSATAWSAASAGAQTRSKITKALAKLIIQVLLYKGVIRQTRTGFKNSGDFRSTPLSNSALVIRCTSNEERGTLLRRGIYVPLLFV